MFYITFEAYKVITDNIVKSLGKLISEDK